MQRTDREGESVYECVGCGERYRDPDSRLCPCGGSLRNVGVERPE